MKKYGYATHEKLKQKKEISFLFEKGKWRSCGRLRIIYVKDDSILNQKVGVSVSKRNFKKAVDRNRIKRLLREAYRLNKNVFTDCFGTHSLSMIFWASKDMPEHFNDVQKDFLNLCKPKK